MRWGVLACAIAACGGPPQPSGSVLFTDTAEVRDLAVDDTALYWTREDGIKKLPLTGSDAVQLVSSQVETQHLAIDATWIYFTNGGTSPNYDGSVMKVALDGSGLTTLVDRLLSPYDIAVDGTSVYWTSANGVFRTSLTIAMEQGDNLSQAIAIDGDHVYWTTTRPFERASLDGSHREQLSVYEPDAEAIAFNGTKVYWANGNAEIKVMPK